MADRSIFCAKLADAQGRAIEVAVGTWDEGEQSGTLWTEDFLGTGRMDYDEEAGAYIVEDVDAVKQDVLDYLNGRGAHAEASLETARARGFESWDELVLKGSEMPFAAIDGRTAWPDALGIE